ncbi:DivIVA domain-containing protein [Spirillospora sp. NPDC048911]|uniref:DivIVA domain-containing protein n=1 Tax=Spirillospora sp. NPDC048911 TaxID=3364527 RepID=UPI00371E9D47
MNTPNLPDPFGDPAGSPAFDSARPESGPPVPAWATPESSQPPGHSPGQVLGQQPSYPVVPAAENQPGQAGPPAQSGSPAQAGVPGQGVVPAQGIAPAQGGLPAPGSPGGFGMLGRDRLTPGEVRAVTFARASLGRRGLDEDHVRSFLDRVEYELAQLGNEKSALAEEIAELRDRLGSAGSDGRGGMAHEEAHFQAVRILSHAQQTADLYVADAERYTRELAHEARLHREAILSDARGRAELMLEEAHQRAAEVAEQAARSAPIVAPARAVEPVPGGAHPGPPALPADERQAMEREIAYLRTYSDVYRTHLRSYLEALLKNVDEWETSERSALPVATTDQPQR